jgi:hypothetical protein
MIALKGFLKEEISAGYLFYGKGVSFCFGNLINNYFFMVYP